jgi:hypothetical protein
VAEIIEIAELRLERVMKGVCFHRHLAYDEANKYIECLDCKLPVQPFEAFMILVRNYGQGLRDLESRRKELQELEAKSEKSLLKATRVVDSVWRSRTMLPCCPHCGRGVTPEDGFGRHRVGKKHELERRKFLGGSPCEKK